MHGRVLLGGGLCYGVLGQSWMLLLSLFTAVHWFLVKAVACAGKSGCIAGSSLQAFWEKKRQVTWGITYTILLLVV